MSLTKENRSVVRTQTLLKNGFIELLKKKPIRKISVRELTDSVNLNRSTFYLHYKDIYDLMDDLKQDAYEHILQISNYYTPDVLQGNPYPLLLDLFRFLKKHASFTHILLIENRDQTFVSKIAELLRERCITDMTLIFGDADPEKCEYYSTFILTGCIGVIEKWIRDDTCQPEEVMAQYTKDFILHGMQNLK